MSAALAIGLSSLASAPAEAYVRTITDRKAPVWWPRHCVTIVVHAADPPGKLTSEAFVTAARNAAAAWSRGAVACTDLDLQIAVAATSRTARVANDGRNNMVFRKTEWCKVPLAPDERCYDSSALAITTVFALQSDGTVLDSDVELNAVDFTWDDLVTHTSETEAQDLQNTLTHELGHLLGLDHNCFVGGPRERPVDHSGQEIPDCSRASRPVQDATMFAAVRQGDVLRRTLSDDDTAGVCGIYPAQGAELCAAVIDPPASPPEEGGCSVVRGGDRGEAAAPMILAGVGLGVMAGLRRAFRARRSRRRPD